MRPSAAPGTKWVNTTSLPAGLNAPRSSDTVGDVAIAVGGGSVQAVPDFTENVTLNGWTAALFAASNSPELPSVITTTAALFVVPKFGSSSSTAPHAFVRTSIHCGPTTVCAHVGCVQSCVRTPLPSTEFE